MEIQDILAFLMKESAERKAERAEQKAENALLRDQLSEQFLAKKSAHAKEKEGSVSPKLQERRGKEEKYEEADFRHQLKTVPEEEKLSYFKRRLSCNTFMNAPTAGSSIVRSIANIDPLKSGVLLTYLDMTAVFKWTQDMRQLQRKHPHEELEYGLFISTNIAMRLNAYNEAKMIMSRVIMDGDTLNIPYEQLI